MTAGRVFYARKDGLVFLKFEGHIRYTFQELHRISTALDGFLDQLFQENTFHDVLIDLAQAESIDSTNLGLLVKLAIFMEKKFGRLPTILSTNPTITETLELSGLGQAFIILTDCEKPEVELDSLPDLETNEREACRIVLEAHKNLFSLNAQNQSVYRDVIELLEKNIDTKQQGA